MGQEPPRTAQPVWMVETPVVPYTPPESLAPAAPSLIAGRYALGEALGRGGHASVWEAEDRVTRTKVALKRFHRQSGPWTARIRREIAALRMLRVPGVVQLLDEGVDEEGAYVVMERVQGAPFPGAEVPVSWERLRPTLIALLETFARIHARGVVHRDIKPGNILVRGDGTPVVLDFGIARWDLGGAITNHGEVLGTPLFLAPEQLQGEPVTPATDLYALGVMLFEALSGSLPFDGPMLQGAMYARLFSDAPSLRRAAPDAPQEAVSLVARLLARSPADRPQSADDVLRGLSSPSGARAQGAPWLGSREVIDHLLDAARSGRSADLTGPPRSGRTRCLAECGRALQEMGKDPRWAQPSPEPFGSLEEILGPLRSASLADAIAEAQEILRRLFREGVVLLCDDVERVDPLSAEVIASLRAEAPVLRALEESHADAPGAWVIPALTVEALMGLVEGTERLFHLRSDAATLLLGASGGRAAAVHDTLDAWTRAGIARRVGDQTYVDREGLARARNLRWHRGGRAAHRTLTPPPRVELLQLHHAMELAGPNATTALLCAVLEITPWRIEAMLGQLVTARVARKTGEGRFEALPTPWMDPGRTPEQIRALHARIAAALPPGAPGRLDHLLFAAETEPREPEVLCAEGVMVALAHAERGHLEDGLLALSDVVAALHRLPAEAWPSVRDFFVVWAELAFADGAPRAMDRLFYELSRVPSPEQIADVIALTRVGLARLGAATNFESQVASLPSSDDPRLERRRSRSGSRRRGPRRRRLSPRCWRRLARARRRCPIPSSTRSSWGGRGACTTAAPTMPRRRARTARRRSARAGSRVAWRTAWPRRRRAWSCTTTRPRSRWRMSRGRWRRACVTRSTRRARVGRARRGCVAGAAAVDQEPCGSAGAGRARGHDAGHDVRGRRRVARAGSRDRAAARRGVTRDLVGARAARLRGPDGDGGDPRGPGGGARGARRDGRAAVDGAVAARGVQVWAMLRDHEGRAREVPPALDAGWREVRALPREIQLEALRVAEVLSTPWMRGGPRFDLAARGAWRS